MTNKVKRVRLNADMRKRAVQVVKDFYESKNSKQKIAMQDAKSMFDDLTPHTHKKIVDIVRSYQPQEDVDTIKRMIAKYNSNGGRIENDACFYIGHEVEKEDYNGNMETANECKQFSFELFGSVDGYSGQDFAYAYYRDELLKNGMQPDEHAMMRVERKDRNPHWTKLKDKMDNYLGESYCSWKSDVETEGKRKKQWTEKYQTEVIGTSYCGSRQFLVSDQEYEALNTWQIAKSNVVKTHQAYAEWISKKTKTLEAAFKSYRYFDEIEKACASIDCPINASQLDGESSMALSVYAPENLKSLLEDDDDQDDHKAQIIAAFKSQRQSAH